MGNKLKQKTMNQAKRKFSATKMRLRFCWTTSQREVKDTSNSGLQDECSFLKLIWQAEKLVDRQDILRGS